MWLAFISSFALSFNSADFIELLLDELSIFAIALSVISLTITFAFNANFPAPPAATII